MKVAKAQSFFPHPHFGRVTCKMIEHTKNYFHYSLLKRLLKTKCTCKSQMNRIIAPATEIEDEKTMRHCYIKQGFYPNNTTCVSCYEPAI